MQADSSQARPRQGQALQPASELQKKSSEFLPAGDGDSEQAEEEEPEKARFYESVNLTQRASLKHWRRTLSIQKRLRDHLIVQKYYDQSPNYRSLAREIMSRTRKKSGVGLLDKNKAIVAEYDQIQLTKQLRLMNKSSLTNS